MAKSKGRRLAEWLRNLDSNSKASSNTLANDSVTAAKIADDAVTNAAIADGAVHTANIADTGVTFAKLHTALVVTESDAIGSNDNDTTIATSAAIKDYVDTQVAGKDNTDEITEGSTNLYFTNARARSALSVTTNSAGTAALSYTSGTGVLSYTPPDLSSYLTTSSAITVGNITTTGYLRGPSTFTIDPATHGDNTGTLVIAGNLQVDGTTTTINSTTMTVDDLNITLASGAANAAAANGAGITVDGASATLTYNGTNDDWNFNKTLNITGTGYVTATKAILEGSHDNILELRSTDDGPLYIEFERATDRHAYLGFGGNNDVFKINNEESGGEIQFLTANTAAVTIDENQMVGIGTTSPDKTLVVSGVGAEIVINDTDTTDTPRLRFRENGVTSGSISTDASALRFDTGTTEQMRIETTGNVEITNGDLDMSGGYIEKQNSELNGYIVGGYNSIGSTANSKTNPIYAIGSAYTPASETSVGGFYGIGMTRARSSGGSNYLADLDWTLNTGWGLYVAAGSGSTIFLDATNGDVNWTGNLAHNGTVVMDSSRDLKNIPLAQIGSITNLNAFGTLQVNQSANNDESGFGILDSTAARSMRLWCDATSSYINSGNGGSGNLILNEAITVSDVGAVTGIRDITPDADGTYNLGTSGTRWANVYADGITARQSTFTISDTTANSSVNAVTLDFNLSGADALTADRTKRGLFIDVDSSATGGDTSNEHRLYGLSVDVRATGDSDLLYGTYSYAESQHSDGQITQVTGVLGYAVGDDTGTGHTTNVYGVQGLAYGYGSGSGGTTSFTALYGKTLLSTANDKNSNVLTGTYSEIEIDDPGQAQTASAAYVFRGEYDDDSGGNVTVTNGYLFYGNYAGTQPTNAYGIYIADAVQSYFGGGNVTGIADLTTTGQLNPQTIYVKSNTYTTTSDIALTSNGVIKSGQGLWLMGGGGQQIAFGVASNDAPTTGWQSVTQIAAMQADGDLYLHQIGSNNAPSADDLILNGYGLMGNRSSPVYVTNAGTGGVQINADGVHGTTYRVALFDQGGITFDDPLSVTGNITSTGNVSSGSTGDVIAYGGATHLSANGIYFENNKHCITKNDGYGNFNIRVGHTHSNAEAATEAGYIFQDEWSQSSGWRQFNVSSASLSVGNTPTWRTQIYYDSDYSSLRYQGSEKGYTYASGFRVTGNLLATSDVYAYYSDERLKDKTGKIENALDKVDAIETFYYTHNDKAIELGYEGKDQQVGVSAQSVEAVMPEVVHLAPIDNDGEGNSISGEDYKTVQYEKLVPLLIEAIKELKAEIEELKK